MVLFTSARPGQRVPGGVAFPPPGFVPPNDDIPDANQTTFYSSMMNVDFEIGDGNPAAVAIRFHVAQHGILSHIDFHIGSGLAGIIEVGNVGQDLRFLGGRYGILTTNTSPFWPYTLHRFGVRGAARGGHPRAPGRPDRGAHDVPRRADRDQHRPRLLRSAVAEGRPVRERPHAPSSLRPRRTRSRRSARRTSSASTRRCSRATATAAAPPAGAGRLPRPALQPRAVRAGRTAPAASTGRYGPEMLAQLPRAARRRRCPRCRRWSNGSTCGRSA